MRVARIILILLSVLVYLSVIGIIIIGGVRNISHSGISFEEPYRVRCFSNQENV